MIYSCGQAATLTWILAIAAGDWTARLLDSFVFPQLFFQKILLSLKSVSRRAFKFLGSGNLKISEKRKYQDSKSFRFQNQNAD